MLHELLVPLSDEIIVFNLVRYLTFRTGMAILTALGVGLLMGPAVIAWLQRRQGKGQPIRDDGPTSHFTKAGTPTMGGVIILVSVLASTLLWSDLSNGFVLVVLLVTAGFGAIGFADDYLKLTRRDSQGLPGRLKLAGQGAAGLAAMLLIVALTRDELATGMALPFFKDVLVELGWFYIVFGIVVMVAAANSVNLTDGLDGLAIVPIMLAALAFATICYLAGNTIYADYLRIFHVPGTGELAIFCGALIGAAMAFLWYNAPPAQVFMGDTGSQASGGALGTMAVITKHELVLPIIGGLFVLEAGSVILQVASVRLTGQRLFRMAPLHHHFEQKGWPETTVVIRFWIIAAVLALIGLSTLKLR